MRVVRNPSRKFKSRRSAEQVSCFGDGGLLQPTGWWKQCACGSHAPAAVELQATRRNRASSETRRESSKTAGPLSKCPEHRSTFQRSEHSQEDLCIGRAKPFGAIRRTREMVSLFPVRQPCKFWLDCLRCCGRRGRPCALEKIPRPQHPCPTADPKPFDRWSRTREMV